MKILLVIMVVQFFNLVSFAWFNRVAALRILVLRQQLPGYKRKSKKLPACMVNSNGPSRRRRSLK